MLSLSLSILTLVSLGAIENLGISTAMPIVERQFGHIGLYGWVFAAYSLSSLFGGSFFGVFGDRYSLRRSLGVAVGVFAFGLALGGVSTSMMTLVGSRIVQGFGYGGFVVLPYMMISRHFEGNQKAKMLAAMASAWIVPSLFIPPLAGIVAESLSWRLVFLGVVPIALASGLLADRALRKIEGDLKSFVQERASIRQVAVRSLGGLGSALSVGMMIYSISVENTLVKYVVLFVGVVVFVASTVRLLSASELFRKRDTVFILLARGLSSFAFFGVESFLPFVLFTVKKMPIAEAGLVLTASSFSWTAGSWIQARASRFVSFKVRVGVGLGIFVISLSALWLNFYDTRLPGGLSIVIWFVAGAGMGVVYPSITLAGLGSAKKGSDSQISSLLQIFDTGGFAISTGLIGALLASGINSLQGGVRIERYASNYEVSIVVACAVALASLLFLISGRYLFLKS